MLHIDSDTDTIACNAQGLRRGPKYAAGQTWCRLALAGLVILLSPSLSLADAFTYVGTQGDAEIVLELTEPADGPVLARYAKKTIGTDTALTPIEVGSERIILKDKTQSARTTTLWTIEGTIGSPKLSGTWQVPELGYALDLSLVLVGSRPYERDRLDPYQSFARLPAGRIDRTGAPYEFSKIRNHYSGEPWSMSGGTYNMVSDPRTKFAFPRVLELGGGASTTPINDILMREHWRIGLKALDCLARTGSLGGYDEQTVEVHYLTSRVMSLVRSATVTCGGSSVVVDRDYLNLDVAAGAPLDMTRVFAGWQGRPGKALADFVRRNAQEDVWQDGECDPGESLPDHLAVIFVEPAAVHFHLTGMSPPCNDRILTQEISGLQPFLAEGALAFFAE